MVFSLIVPLPVMMQEYSNVLHLFLMSKRNFFVSKESDSFINIEFLLLNSRPLVLFSFRLYLLANRASHDGLSLNFTIISPFFVVWYFNLSFFDICGPYLAQFVHNIGVVLILCHRYLAYIFRTLKYNIKKGLYFSFDFGRYSIHLDIVC